MPFDIGRFLETGGKYAYEILSEEKKHEKKLDEIEAKLKADKEQTQSTLDAGIKEGRVKGLYDFMKSDASGESKVKMWEMHSSEGLVPSLYQIQNMAATQTGQTMPGGTAGATAPGGVAGVGGLYDGTQYTPPETGGIPKMFDPQPEEPKPPTPIAPEKIREQAFRLTTSVMRGPQFQELLSGLDPKARIKFEKDFAQMLERTYKFLQAGQFPEMRRTEEEWDELYGE